jgi:transposase-like protein
VKIKGKINWLYRAVDAKGNSVDFFLSQTQNKPAAKAFFEKALKKTSNPTPEKVTIDGHQAYPWAIKDLKDAKTLSKKVKHRTSKDLNNRIESDHARFKQKLKPMRRFKDFESAEKAIAGQEAMLMLKKRQFIAMKVYQSEVDFVHSLFGLTA